MSDDRADQNYWDMRMAQQIRESSQALREIETKLRAAYVHKSLAHQMAEKEKVRLQEQLERQTEIQKFNERQRNEIEEEQERKRVTKVNKKIYRGELEEQMLEKCRKRKRLYEEFLSEKIVFDEIMRQIQQEQIDEMKEKIRRSECLREDIEQIIADQLKWHEEQKRIEEEENKRIRAYIEQQDAKMMQAKGAKAEQLRKQSEMQTQMCAHLNEIERKRIEREEILIDLKFHELEEKQCQQERSQLEERIRRRMLTKFQLDEQRRENELRRVQKEQSDREFRAEQLKLLAERDRLDSMTAERQRIKKAEHHRAVRALLDEREARRHCEIVELVKENRQFIEMEKRRQRIYEEERKKLLQRYANELIGFLPADLLQF